MNSSLAIAASKAFIHKYPNVVGSINIVLSTWTKSLFKRMGYVRRMKTLSKIKIPDGARRETEFPFHHEIVTMTEKHNIPVSMIINIDQTPLKYVPTSNFILVEHGTTSVTMEGGSDKRYIIGTLSIPFSNKFLPMQLIYDGKIVQSLPHFKFPQEFSLSANPTIFPNRL